MRVEQLPLSIALRCRTTRSADVYDCLPVAAQSSATSSGGARSSGLSGTCAAYHRSCTARAQLLCMLVGLSTELTRHTTLNALALSDSVSRPRVQYSCTAVY